jgi:hypothetical protein
VQNSDGTRDQNGTDSERASTEGRRTRRRVLKTGAAVIVGVSAAAYMKPSMVSLGVPTALAWTSTVPISFHADDPWHHDKPGEHDHPDNPRSVHHDEQDNKSGNNDKSWSGGKSDNGTHSNNNSGPNGH